MAKDIFNRFFGYFQLISIGFELANSVRDIPDSEPDLVAAKFYASKWNELFIELFIRNNSKVGKA